MRGRARAAARDNQARLAASPADALEALEPAFVTLLIVLRCPTCDAAAHRERHAPPEQPVTRLCSRVSPGGRAMVTTNGLADAVGDRPRATCPGSCSYRSRDSASCWPTASAHSDSTSTRPRRRSWCGPCTGSPTLYVGLHTVPRRRGRPPEHPAPRVRLNTAPRHEVSVLKGWGSAAVLAPGGDVCSRAGSRDRCPGALADFSAALVDASGTSPATCPRSGPARRRSAGALRGGRPCSG